MFFKKSIPGRDIPDSYEVPKEDDTWNAHITKISNLGHVYISGCVTPKINILECYSIIFITPNTTKKDIIQDWKKIEKVRDDLASMQGSSTGYAFDYRQFVYELHKVHGLGYGELAKFLNLELMVIMSIGLQVVQEYRIIDPDRFLLYFHNFLFAFGFVEEEIVSWKEKAETELHQGKLPWKPDFGPFEQDKVREYVRSFSKVISNKEIKLSGKSLDLLHFFELYESRSFIINLLYKSYPLDKKKYSRYVEKWQILTALMLLRQLSNPRYFNPLPATLGDLDQFFP